MTLLHRDWRREIYCRTWVDSGMDSRSLETPWSWDLALGFLWSGGEGGSTEGESHLPESRAVETQLSQSVGDPEQGEEKVPLR